MAGKLENQGRILVIARLLMVGVLALLSFSQANAANDKAGATCLQSCRTDLKRSGKWSSYPYGYCRNKCDYWAGPQGQTLVGNRHLQLTAFLSEAHAPIGTFRDAGQPCTMSAPGGRPDIPHLGRDVTKSDPERTLGREQALALLTLTQHSFAARVLRPVLWGADVGGASSLGWSVVRRRGRAGRCAAASGQGAGASD